MSNVSRATKHRHKRQSKGFKTISVTISPEARTALSVIQDSYGISQWEAVSRALIHAAADVEALRDPATLEPPRIASEIDELKRMLRQQARRLEALERGAPAAEPLAHAEDVQPESAMDDHPAPAAPDEPDTAPELSETDIDALLDFAALMFLEHGQAISRSRTYNLAVESGLSVHGSEEAFGTFLHENLGEISRRLKLLREQG